MNDRDQGNLAGLLGDMIQTLDHCAMEMQKLSKKVGQLAGGEAQALELDRMGTLNTRTARKLDEVLVRLAQGDEVKPEVLAYGHFLKELSRQNLEGTGSLLDVVEQKLYTRKDPE